MNTAMDNVVYDVSKSALINTVSQKVFEIVEKPKKIIYDFASGSFRTPEGILVVGVSNITIKT